MIMGFLILILLVGFELFGTYEEPRLALALGIYF
jgi:hypothetical protein